MSLNSTLIASRSLARPSALLVVSIVGTCRTPTVTGKLTNFVAFVAFGSTRTIMHKSCRYSTSCFGVVVVVVGYYLAFSCSLSDGKTFSHKAMPVLNNVVVPYLHRYLSLSNSTDSGYAGALFPFSQSMSQFDNSLPYLFIYNLEVGILDCLGKCTTSGLDHFSLALFLNLLLATLHSRLHHVLPKTAVMPWSSLLKLGISDNLQCLYEMLLPHVICRQHLFNHRMPPTVSRQFKCKGGIPDDGASGLVWESMMDGGNGSEWEVDAALALSQIIWWEKLSVEDVVNDNGEGGDDGRVDIARSLATSASD
ncbi:hypothetical protein Tco_0411856 [Tanacetum coccineum]